MSDEREPNNRSDAALRERLEIAGKAAEGPWQTDVIPPEMVGFRPRYVIRDEKGIVIVEEVHHFASWQKTGQHIAASSPDAVRADIEEILRLRAEVARLNKESDWFIEYIWNKDIFRCPMPEGYICEHKLKHICCLDSEETEIRGRCWREAARKAVEEEERHG